MLEKEQKENEMIQSVDEINTRQRYVFASELIMPDLKSIADHDKLFRVTLITKRSSVFLFVLFDH